MYYAPGEWGEGIEWAILLFGGGGGGGIHFYGGLNRQKRRLSMIPPHILKQCLERGEKMVGECESLSEWALAHYHLMTHATCTYLH